VGFAAATVFFLLWSSQVSFNSWKRAGDIFSVDKALKKPVPPASSLTWQL
jgi:hypothetical protein